MFPRNTSVIKLGMKQDAELKYYKMQKPSLKRCTLDYIHIYIADKTTCQCSKYFKLQITASQQAGEAAQSVMFNVNLLLHVTAKIIPSKLGGAEVEHRSSPRFSTWGPTFTFVHFPLYSTFQMAIFPSCFPAPLRTQRSSAEQSDITLSLWPCSSFRTWWRSASRT